MKKFTLRSNSCLEQSTQGFFSVDYVGYQHPRNPDFLNMLKNDFGEKGLFVLQKAKESLEKTATRDLKKIIQRYHRKPTICVVPRSKKLTHYSVKQLGFLDTIKRMIGTMNCEDGTDYIRRIKDTKTTHLSRSDYAGGGSMPYCGIAKDTCAFSSDIKGKDILLIDDIYTKTVNIDEDMIQALLDNGAKSVAFYAVAYTVYKG